jgi:hypothetical protein
MKRACVAFMCFGSPKSALFSFAFAILIFTVLSFLQTHLAFSIQASSLESTVLVSKERGDKKTGYL